MPPPHKGCRARSIACYLILALLAGSAAGCVGSSTRSKRVWTQAQAEGILLQALEEQAPDDRRLAIRRISRSKYVGESITIKAMSLIVKTDASQIVRRQAARTLGLSGQQQAFEPLLVVLDAENHLKEVLTPDVALKRTCLDELHRLLTAGLLPAESAKVIDIARRHLREEPDREVRMASCRVLCCFRKPDALDALIEALDQPEFAVNHEAERALIRLTGSTHHGDAQQWRAWREKTADPFARAGQQPAEVAQGSKSRPWWKPFGR